MLLERTSDVFPIPLLFKPLPKGKYEEKINRNKTIKPVSVKYSSTNGFYSYYV